MKALPHCIAWIRVRQGIRKKMQEHYLSKFQLPATFRTAASWAVFWEFSPCDGGKDPNLTLNSGVEGDHLQISTHPAWRVMRT